MEAEKSHNLPDRLSAIEDQEYGGVIPSKSKGLRNTGQ